MKNLMIIEHDDHVRENLGEFTKKLGFNPILISDPLACNATKSSAKQCPATKPCAEILLVDNDCPAINGLSLIELQEGKGCSVHSKQKALMASKLSDEDAEKAISYGCHVISKPVTFHDLERWLIRLGESSD